MTARTRIKICGVRRPADVDAAVDAGADAVGLVFFARSPRNVTLADAAALARDLPPFVSPVGLFVDAEPAVIEAVLYAVPNLLLQFHGDETPAACSAFERPYLKAVRMSPGVDLVDAATRFADARGLVVDADSDGYGGSGRVFDWSLVPAGLSRPLVLSGGLHAGNVMAAVRTLRPWGVDVSSGVESTRGVKSSVAIRRFCEAVREADSRIEASTA